MRCDSMLQHATTGDSKQHAYCTFLVLRERTVANTSISIYLKTIFYVIKNLPFSITPYYTKLRQQTENTNMFFSVYLKQVFPPRFDVELKTQMNIIKVFHLPTDALFINPRKL
jgi:hypothetical protein